VNGAQKLYDAPLGNGWEAIKIANSILTEAPRELGEGLATGDARKIVNGGAQTGLLYMGGRQIGRRCARRPGPGAGVGEGTEGGPAAQAAGEAAAEAGSGAVVEAEAAATEAAAEAAVTEAAAEAATTGAVEAEAVASEAAAAEAAAEAAATEAAAVRPATQQPMGGNGIILRDGAGATADEIAASTGGPNGGSRAGQGAVRDQLIQDWQQQNPGQPFRCWRCGATSTNPADFHVEHRNVPTSLGGNLDPPNVTLEGASCNLSAGNRGGPTSGMSCWERGSPGAPFGR
jgi:hypothetical protein